MLDEKVGIYYNNYLLQHQPLALIRNVLLVYYHYHIRKFV